VITLERSLDNHGTKDDTVLASAGGLASRQRTEIIEQEFGFPGPARRKQGERLGTASDENDKNSCRQLASCKEPRVRSRVAIL